MKIFHAVWNGGRKQETLLCTRVKVEENIVFLYVENEIVGQFDMGCLDIWYVKKDCEPHRRSGSGRGGRGAGSEERRCQHDRVDGGRPATSESAPGDSRQPEGTGGDAACVTDGDH